MIDQKYSLIGIDKSLIKMQPLSVDITRQQPVTIDIKVIADNMVKAIDSVARFLRRTFPSAADYQMKHWIQSLPTRGWIEGDYAYLIIMDDDRPSEAYILKERIR